MPRKGPATPEATERAYAYVVEMIVAEGGFGRKLDAMHQVHAGHGVQSSAGAAATKKDATTFDGASLIPK